MKERIARLAQLLKTIPPKRLLAIAGLLIIAAAIPLTVFVAQQQQETRQQAATQTCQQAGGICFLEGAAPEDHKLIGGVTCPQGTQRCYKPPAKACSSNGCQPSQAGQTICNSNNAQVYECKLNTSKNCYEYTFKQQCGGPGYCKGSGTKASCGAGAGGTECVVPSTKCGTGANAGKYYLCSAGYWGKPLDCPSGQICKSSGSTGSCQPTQPSTCQNECVKGSWQCSGTAARECVQADVNCNKWLTRDTCTSNETCQMSLGKSYCVAKSSSCLSPCTGPDKVGSQVGKTRCSESNHAVQTCKQNPGNLDCYQWIDTTLCSKNSCDSTTGARCLSTSTACTGTQQRCGGSFAGGFQQCSSGQWKSFDCNTSAVGATCTLVAANDVSCVCGSGKEIKTVNGKKTCVTKVAQATQTPRPTAVVTPRPTGGQGGPQPTATTGCTLNGVKVAVGTRFCRGFSYTGQACTAGTSVGTCQSNGTWSYTSCGSGQRCRYSSPTQASCSNTCVNVTPRPTPTGTAQASPTTPASGETVLNFNLGLDGLGTTGDHQNPTGVVNPNPNTKSRPFTVEVLGPANAVVRNGTGTLQFSGGRFMGQVNFGSGFTTGNYRVLVKSPLYLKRDLGGIIPITGGTTNNMPQVNLTTGDIVDDNAITIADYNVLFSCSIFGTDNKGACGSHNADLTDNGVVDQDDYNLLLREWVVQFGDMANNGIQNTVLAQALDADTTGGGEVSIQALEKAIQTPDINDDKKIDQQDMAIRDLTADYLELKKTGQTDSPVLKTIQSLTKTSASSTSKNTSVKSGGLLSTILGLFTGRSSTTSTQSTNNCPVDFGDNGGYLSAMSASLSSMCGDTSAYECFLRSRGAQDDDVQSAVNQAQNCPLTGGWASCEYSRQAAKNACAGKAMVPDEALDIPYRGDGVSCSSNTSGPNSCNQYSAEYYGEMANRGLLSPVNTAIQQKLAQCGGRPYVEKNDGTIECSPVAQ